MKLTKTAVAFVFTAVTGVADMTTAQAGEPIWDANTIEMQSEQLADGVYAFYGKDTPAKNAQGAAAATSGGLIVGTRGSLLIDTMLNQRLHTQLRTLSAKLGQVPASAGFSYAVNTSAHGDHSYGNMYLPASTRVIQHQHTADYIKGHLADDKAFMVQYFGTGRGIEPINARPADLLIPQNGKLSLDLGGKTVDIIDFGFAQTGGDLFVWEASSKTLWAGNAFIAAKPALPWLLDGRLLETLDTFNKVYAFLPDDARVVPGHGVPIKKSDLKWHLDYLSAVKTQVSQAVAQGLSLEQTVQQVQMPEFGGYQLFGWVHSGLNVPAAYRDLSPANIATSSSPAPTKTN